MAASLILADSPRARFATGSIMYFAQGIPQGLMSIAIPAWLASQGVSAADIGSYLAVIVLPWAFKLVTGPLMDRYEFLPMGRRRPWVIGAQLGLSLSLLALMLVENPVEQIGLLMLIGVLINSFAATQDVAVDGMSIDLTPVREQGRLNAFMSFGKGRGVGRAPRYLGPEAYGDSRISRCRHRAARHNLCCRTRGRAHPALDLRQRGVGASTRQLFQSGIRRSQQSALGACQCDRHGHHALRRPGNRLRPGIDADRGGEAVWLHDAAMVATGCHDGFDRRRYRTRARPADRSLRTLS
jgi:hypothetical protein